MESFDKQSRSCKKQLEKHNERRRAGRARGAAERTASAVAARVELAAADAVTLAAAAGLAAATEAAP